MPQFMRSYTARRFSLFAALLFVSVVIGGSVAPVWAAGQAYWATPDGSAVQLSSLDLAVGETRTIRLMADVPSGQTLKAYKFTLTYDQTKITLNSVSDSPNAAIPTAVINDTTAGEIVFNGYDTTGVAGAATVSFIDVNITGAAAGTFSFGISVDNFGSDASTEFKPTPVNMQTAVTDITTGGNEVYWVDSNGARLDQVDLNDGESATLTLVAEVPTGKTLNAFKFSVTYDDTLVSLVDPPSMAAGNPFSTQGYINSGMAGTIVVNGFDANGVTGAASVQLIDATFTALTQTGYFNLTTEALAFGSSATDEFPPTPADMWLTTNGGIIEHTITASAGTGGSISPVGAVQVKRGDSQTFTITANTNYVIQDVTKDGASVGAVSSYTFPSVSAEHTIAATFRYVQPYVPPTTYSVTASVSGEGGTISPTSGQVNSGGSQTFTITPDAGYVVDTFTVNGTDRKSEIVNNEFTLSGIYSNSTIVVSFKAADYVVSASAGANGSIDPSGDTPVGPGDDLTITVTPNAGYKVATFLVDGVDRIAELDDNNQFMITDIQRNYTVEVTFVDDEIFIINASAGPNGSIEPSGTLPADRGANVQFSITPDDGYVVDTVLVNGEDRTSEYQSLWFWFPLENIDRDYTVLVTFIPSGVPSYTIVASSGNNGTISPSGNVSVAAGGDQTFTITPAGGYQIADVVVNGSSVGAVANYIFTGVSVDQTIHATFDIDPNILETESPAMDGLIVGIQKGTNVDELLSLEGIDPDTLPVPDGLDVPFGLVGFEITPIDSGLESEIVLYFSEDIPDNEMWYLYTEAFGWDDYAEYVTPRDDGKSVTVRLMDGGFGDADGEQDGVITVPYLGFAVSDCGAVATFTVVPRGGEEPLTVDLNAAGSVGDLTWDYGDGSKQGTAMMSVHTYTDPGVYTITLTASIGDCQVSTQKNITVTKEQIDTPKSDDDCFISASTGGSSSLMTALAGFMALAAGAALMRRRNH